MSSLNAKLVRLAGRGLILLGLVAVSALALALGSQGTLPERLTVMLDWFPNPNHVPLYVAKEEGFFAAEGLELELLVPASPSDPVKLAAVGKVDIAITTGMNLIIARAEDLPLVAIGALIQRPLGGLLALEKGGISRLEDLRGRRIGYSLEPEELILWEAMLGCVGLEPGTYELINVGFNTVAALLAGSVDAIGAFRNYEKLVVELQGEETVFFPMEEYCIPEHYQLVFVVSKRTLSGRARALGEFIRGLAQGIRFTLSDPNKALDIFFEVHPELDDELNLRSFLATLLYFVGSPCVNAAGKWTELQDFLYEWGLIQKRAALEELFTEEFLPPECFG